MYSKSFITPKTSERFGQWGSPISCEVASAQSGSLGWPRVSGDSTWWCVTDPESATVRLMHRDSDGLITDVLSEEYSVGNSLCGYGGRPYTISNDSIIFTSRIDQRMYRAGRRDIKGIALPLTPQDSDGYITCYADPILHADEIWCVREITRPSNGVHDVDPMQLTSRQIVAIPLSGEGSSDESKIRVVARSHHFLACPRISPDGTRLVWIGWDHPLMPWDATTVMVADLLGGVASASQIAYSLPNVSIPQVEWRDKNSIYALADPAGWWNLHVLQESNNAWSLECAVPMERECGDAMWRIGETWFQVLGSDVVFRHGFGEQALALFNSETGAITEIASGWTEFGSYISCDGTSLAVIAGSKDRTKTVIRIEIGRDGSPSTVTECTERPESTFESWMSSADRRVAIGKDGSPVHFIYYPPNNPEFCGPEDEFPPLLIHAHGGPTHGTSATPDMEFSLFTSRGFAVASVDYGGSTGYGREYRERLRHRWGIVDVDDCVTVAQFLSTEGAVDPKRIAIRGGSAGGWTALAALTKTNVFCCGAVYYPISDALEWSFEHTHDFESRYLESMIGTLPQDRAHYESVSPLHNVAGIKVPLILLQGLLDKICPPVQSQKISDALTRMGMWHRLLFFEGEGHGFRQASTIQACLHAEADLYSAIMGVTIDLGCESARSAVDVHNSFESEGERDD